MKIKGWHKPQEQMAILGRHSWNVARLFELSKDLPVMDIPINHMNIAYSYDTITLRDFVMHMQAVNDADLTKPIILDEEGNIMDGRHRLMKAILTRQETIKAVRFEENPLPCQIT